jgi:hypothetical protein
VFRRCTILGLLVAALLALRLPAAMPAEAAPTLTLTPTLPADRVRQVPPTASGLTQAVEVTVTPSAPTTVTIFAQGEGLSVAEPVREVDVTGSTTLSFAVSGDEPGRHALQISADAVDGSSASAWLPVMWTTGSTLPEPVGGLDSAFAWSGTASTRSTAFLGLDQGGWAYVGAPSHGVPKCTATTQPGCEPAAVGDPYRLIAIGSNIVGQFREGTLDTDGLAPADSATGQLYGHADDLVPLYVPHGPLDLELLSGRYAYVAPRGSTGLTLEKLRVDPDGRYRLSYGYDGGRPRHASGTIRLGRRGAVDLLVNGEVALSGTLLAACRKIDTIPRPRVYGVWLGLSGTHRHPPDGNLLLPRH